MPTEVSCVTIEEEPKLTKGSGMPVIGMMPMHMPTFWSSWKDHMVAQPARTSFPKGDSTRWAKSMVERIIVAKSPSSTTDPTKPNS